MRKLLKKQGHAPTVLVTDKLRSYGAARKAIGLRPATSRACGRTTGPRTRISLSGGGNGRCSGSSQPDQPSASCPFIPPSITPSTSNLT
jgi:transposase-like protein